MNAAISWEPLGATVDNSGNPQHLRNSRFLPSLRRGRIRLRLYLLSLVDVVRDTAVHRRKGLFERSLFVQIIEAAHTEGPDKQLPLRLTNSSTNDEA